MSSIPPTEHDNDLEKKPSSSGTHTVTVVPVSQIISMAERGKLGRLDEAAELAAEKREFSPEFYAKLRKKIDHRIMAFAAAIYFLQFLDKNALSYAAVMGIRTDTHLVGQEYSLLGVAFYVAYIAAEFPMQYLAQRLPLAKTLAVNVICWSIVLGCTAATNDFGSLMAVRTLLGVFEACVAPILLLVMSMWYLKSEQAGRISYFYVCNGLTQVFCSLLAYGISFIHNGRLASWRVLFIALAAMTFVVGVACWIFMPDNPTNAKFLTRDERLAAVERVRSNQSGIESKRFKKAQFWEAIEDSRTWMLFLMCILSSTPNGSLSLFTQIVLTSFGFSSQEALALSAPSGVFSVIATLVTGWIADRKNDRTLVMFIGLLPTLIGAVILVALGTDSSKKGALLFGIYLTGFISPLFMVCLAYAASNTAGHTKKGTVNSLVLIAFAAGNTIGTQTFQAKDAPNYLPGKIAMVVLLAATGVLAVALHFANRRLNFRKARDLVELEKDMTFEERRSARDTSAFLDMTDKENPYFVYTN